MNESLAKAIISKFFPNLTISTIDKIGEGTGNVAFEVNSDFIFRFPKKPENQKQLEREISIQNMLATYSSLPFPQFIFIPPDHSFVGYKKILGASILAKQYEYIDWKTISKQLGNFLKKLHSIESKEMNDLNILLEERSFSDWLLQAQDNFEKTKHLIDERYFHNIAAFFQSKPPEHTQSSVFCHNDLGIEHILVINNKVSGMIDWGGAAITDPACDFARIYRDVGEIIMNLIVDEYVLQEDEKAELRNRAIFYGKCLFFEDLFYGIGQEKYEIKARAALEWMF